MASFQQQIKQCWKQRSADVAIDVSLSFKPDGTLAGEPVLVHPSDAVDHPKAVAAVLGTIKQCVPIRLPPESYESWKTIEAAFIDEKRLLGASPTQAGCCSK